jgi:hypothetical protein
VHSSHSGTATILHHGRANRGFTLTLHHGRANQGLTKALPSSQLLQVRLNALAGATPIADVVRALSRVSLLVPIEALPYQTWTRNLICFGSYHHQQQRSFFFLIPRPMIDLLRNISETHLNYQCQSSPTTHPIQPSHFIYYAPSCDYLLLNFN